MTYEATRYINPETGATDLVLSFTGLTRTEYDDIDLLLGSPARTVTYNLIQTPYTLRQILADIAEYQQFEYVVALDFDMEDLDMENMGEPLAMRIFGDTIAADEAKTNLQWSLMGNNKIVVQGILDTDLFLHLNVNEWYAVCRGENYVGDGIYDTPQKAAEKAATLTEHDGTVIDLAHW